jgi:hypothetical protein
MQMRPHIGPHPSGDESAKQRLDRNFNELLQELRVAQTGVQILLGFLLAMAFTTRFRTLSGWQSTLYGIAICSATLAMGVLVSPVPLHRSLFRRQRRREVVQLSHYFMSAGLAAMCVPVTASVALALSVTFTTSLTVLISATVAVVFVCLWLVLPMALRASQRVPSDDPHSADSRWVGPSHDESD